VASAHPRGPLLDDMMFVPGSFDIVDLGVCELGLPGNPRAPLLPASWRQVAGVAELTCSWVATVHRLLKETLAMVDLDVLQPAWVSPKMKRRVFYLIFPSSPSAP
jgi:hypothetical protein